MKIPKPHELRVLQERAELFEKIEKLHAFISSDASSVAAIGRDQRSLLIEQCEAMTRYEFILDRRINLF